MRRRIRSRPRPNCPADDASSKSAGRLLAQLLRLPGSVHRLVELAAGYAKVRHQFGRSLGSFQAIKHQLAHALSLNVLAGRAVQAAAYRVAVVGLQHNPVIAAHYARKRAAGKSPMNALGHCMRKALGLVWGVWRNGVDFDPNWSART